MEKRRLGNSDLELSVIGMGCWQYGGGNYWGEQSQKDVNEVVHHALDQGVNYFDTAEMYNEGESERSLGRALQGKREKAFIGTKVTPANAYPNDLRRSCEISLLRLNTDYIDLYMVHWPLNPMSIKHFTDNQDKISNPPHIDEVFGTLTELRKEGKIRYIGISNFGVKQMEELKKLNIEINSNELPYNLVSRGIEKEILPYCKRNNIGIISYMPIQQGLLTGKYLSVDEVNPNRASSRHFHHSRSESSRHFEEGAEFEINQALQKLKKLSDQVGIPMLNLSLAWVISNSNFAD